MEEIKKFWKVHRKAIIAWTLVGFFVPLLVVHLLFKWYSGIDFLVAEWGAGDLLGYIGTILTFIGTIVLSILALQVSNKANELSNKVIEIEQNRNRL